MPARSKPWGQTKPSAGWRPDTGRAANAGLLGAWMCNEGGGGLFFDCLNEGIAPAKGANTGDWASGLFGPAAYFNGTSSVITLPNAATAGPYKPAFPVTFACWVKMLTADSGSNQPVFCNDLFSASAYAGVTMASNGAGAWEIDYGDGVSTGTSHRKSLVSTATWTVGTWYRLVAVFPSNVTPLLYINGQSAAGTASGTATALGYSTQAGTIGGDQSGGAAWSSSVIDMVMIANQAWLPEFIRYDYQNPMWLMQSPKAPMVNKPATGTHTGWAGRRSLAQSGSPA